MNRILIRAVVLSSMVTATDVAAEILFESGTLGPTGVMWSDLENGTVPGTNVSQFAFPGVRFHLDQPAITTRVGGHFASPSGGTFFGAIGKLDDENDFPDSGDLSTPDVLGAAELIFPLPSSEVLGELELSLDPGWYALVFGSGLFGATGYGGTVQNGTDIGSPSYIAFQPGFGWSNPINPIFRNYRFVVQGQLVPEPAAIYLMSMLGLTLMSIRGPNRG